MATYGDPANDILSLGFVLYELAFGEEPRNLTRAGGLTLLPSLLGKWDYKTSDVLKDILHNTTMEIKELRPRAQQLV